MANLALALDEIINQGKSPRGGGGNKRAAVGIRRARGSALSNTRSRQRGFVSGEVPAGRWKHDKFIEEYGGGKRRTGGGGAAAGSSVGILKSIKGGRSIGARIARKQSGGSSGMVKLQISNLPESVVTSDLEELFQDYTVLGVAVHYDEMGSHLGTADMFTDQSTASVVLRDFKNIAIDGQEIKFSLVTEGGNTSAAITGKKSIRDRLQRVSGGSNAIRKKVQVRKRVSGGPIKKAGRGGAGGGRKGGGAKTEKTNKVKTADELDKELEAYMKKL